MIWVKRVQLSAHVCQDKDIPDTHVSLTWLDNQKGHSWQLANVMC